MSGPLPTISFDSGSMDSPNDRRGHSPRFRAPIVILVAALIPATAYLITAKASLRAQDGAPKDAKAPATQSAAVSDFIREIEQILKRQNDRMATIAAPTLAAVDAFDRVSDRSIVQSMATHTAGERYKDAKLSRELAEIGIIEYKAGTAVQELAVAEGMVKLAQSDLERARNDTAEAKTRLARITRLDNESASSLSLVFMYTDRLKAAELEQLKAKYVIEQAESKRKVLAEFAQRKHLMELQSDIEKMHSIELSNHADWDIQKSRLEKLEEAVKDDRPTRNEKRALAMLDQAILLEHSIRAKLDQLAKVGKTDPTLQREIHDLTNQLQNDVNRADAWQTAAQFAKLGEKIHRAAQR
jgi:hypothetical protein